MGWCIVIRGRAGFVTISLFIDLAGGFSGSRCFVSRSLFFQGCDAFGEVSRRNVEVGSLELLNGGSLWWGREMLGGRTLGRISISIYLCSRIEWGLYLLLLFKTCVDSVVLQVVLMWQWCHMIGVQFMFRVTVTPVWTWTFPSESIGNHLKIPDPPPNPQILSGGIILRISI